MNLPISVHKPYGYDRKLSSHAASVRSVAPQSRFGKCRFRRPTQVTTQHLRAGKTFKKNHISTSLQSTLYCSVSSKKHTYTTYKWIKLILFRMLQLGLVVILFIIYTIIPVCIDSNYNHIIYTPHEVRFRRSHTYV